MASSEYWKRAALLREIAVQEGATATAKDVLKLYDEALDDINAEIEKIKYNYRRRYGIDEETAAYFLSRSQQEDNLNMLIQALESAPNEKARKAILEYINLDGLSTRAYASRIERYDAVKQSIYARIKKLATGQITLVGGMLKQAYGESYYGNIDDTAKGLDVGISFGVLNDDAISEAVGAKWSGKRFSERIWDNTDRLAKTAQDLVVKALMSGESLNKTAAKLTEEFAVEKYRATTLIHTETAHVHAAADKKAYEDLGAKEYKYLATLDYATCEVCQPLDGRVFKLSDAKEGVNFPVMHPRCRCTTTLNIDYTNRRARNPLTGKNELVDGDMTYDEWIKSLTPEQKAALETSRKKDANKTADKLQYANYKKRLGAKNVPSTFDKWQEMKYNRVSEYELYKSTYGNAIEVIKGGADGKQSIILSKREEIKAIPNSITQVVHKGGGINRNFYDSEGLQYLQISNNNHGNPKQHPFGANGEHAHDYIYNDNGALISRPQREISDDERKANGDIL